jgi:hypothetical protein
MSERIKALWGSAQPKQKEVHLTEDIETDINPFAHIGQFTRVALPEECGEDRDPEGELHWNDKVGEIYLTENVMTSRQALRNAIDRPFFYKAMSCEWRDMRYEIKVLGDPVPIGSIPGDAEILGMKWNMELKPDREGDARYKARLTARGDQESISEDESTYAPTATKDSVRMLAALSVRRRWKRRVWDISKAFLKTDVSDKAFKIYLREPQLPPGEASAGPGMVYPLLKNIYGLSRAPRLWYEDFVQCLTEYGFQQSDADLCLFSKKNERGKVVCALVLHVDDMLVTGGDREMTKLERFITGRYEIRTQGDEPNKYCGMEITALTDGGIRLHQKKYIEIVMERFAPERKEGIQPRTPMKKHLAPGEGDNTNNRPYRQLVGALLYVAICTRPEVAFAITHLCRHSRNYQEIHWEAALRVLGYLYGTRESGIEYHPADIDIQDELNCYTDADHGSSDHLRRNVSGAMALWGKYLLSWKSVLQRRIQLGTHGAELVALIRAIQMGLYIRRLLESIGIRIEKVNMGCDQDLVVRGVRDGSIIASDAVKYQELPCRWVMQNCSAIGGE